MLFLAQFLLLCQLVTHIPFIYYIGREQLLMAYNEAVNDKNTIVNMVDRVIKENGDPRYYLAELK